MHAPDYQAETGQCVLIGRMLGRVTDKWTVLIVRVLGRGPRRFNALRREVGEISQKVLASTLRDLEENGLVSRTVTPVNPPQVEYALTISAGSSYALSEASPSGFWKMPLASKRRARPMLRGPWLLFPDSFIAKFRSE